MRIKKTTYTIESDRNMTIAVIADLHDQNPDGALKILKEVNPDIILVPGDLMERHAFNPIEAKSSVIRLFMSIDDLLEKVRKTEIAFNKENGHRFLREAVKVAPVVMSLGNHEDNLTEEDCHVITETGAMLLDNMDQLKEGILYGGLSEVPDFEWLREYSKKDGFKILLCHRPEVYANRIKGTDMDTFDLVVSGHAHGGQVRLFGKGLYAPGQGSFPKLTSGEYGKHIVSAGLSNTVTVPRIGNPYEVVVIKLEK